MYICTMKCGNIKCNKEHDGSYGSGKFCSRACANSRNHSEEIKKKISNSCKNSENVKVANLKINKKKAESRRVINTCPVCNIGIITTIKRNKRYHKKCWEKISGGYKKGSSRGKHGYYKTIWCDSSYELAWVIYHIDHNILFKRNNKGFKYFYKGVKHLYYPDFIINGQYIEVKNFKSDITNEKIKQFPYDISVLYTEDMKKEILPYVINKYGKDFVRLYEG